MLAFTCSLIAAFLIYKVYKYMTSTVFSPGTVIASDWLNDVNTAVYFPTSTEPLYKRIKADFGAVGNGISNDTFAFTAAEASTDTKIWLEEGTYNVITGSPLLKTYLGQGKILLNGNIVGQTYGNINVLTPNVSSPAAYGEGDITHIFKENWVIEGVRENLQQYYFESRTTPHFAEMTNNTGHSGGSAKIMAAMLSGATTCTINAAGTEIVPGAVVQIVGGPGGGGTPGDILTILSVVGTTVTFTSGTTQSYPASSTGHYYLTTANRTMNPYQYVGLDHRGGGDAYAHVARVNVYNDNQQPGQTHFFTTATGSMYGGDMTGCTAGVYLTGMEQQYTDNTFGGIKNIAVISNVQSFNRNIDNGTYGCIWNGTLFKSEGTVYCNSAHVIQGKWKRGIDTVLGDFGTDQMAILMKADQKIGFNGFTTADSDGYSLWGSVSSTTHIGLNSSLGAMEHVVNGTSVLRYNATDVYTGTAKLHFGNDAFQNHNQKLFFDGNVGSPKNYIMDDATNLGVYYNNSARMLINNSFVYIGNTAVEVQINQTLNLTGQTVTNSATAGVATALPANPFTYLTIKLGGVAYKIPVYNT